MESMMLWLGALNLGLLYGCMAIGSYITFKILNFADITVDGSFTFGAAVAAILITIGINPLLASLIAFFAGGLAGIATGLIYSKLKIHGLLAGILVMISLYSINLHIMSQSNIPLLNHQSFTNILDKVNPGINSELWLSFCLIIIFSFIWILISLFFKTDFGLTIRALGNNIEMSRAGGINVDAYMIFGIALGNAMAAISGALVAQYQGFADINMGIGTLMIGLASVIIGQAILKNNSIFIKILSAIAGSVIFRFVIAFALSQGMNPVDLKLMTAIFVLITLALTKISGRKIIEFARIKRKFVIIASVVIVGICGYFIISNIISSQNSNKNKIIKIGVVQLISNGLLDVTRNSFSEEMKKIGYIDGKNCIIVYENAHGEQPTVNSILDKFVMDKMDIIVPISTLVTQAAIGKIKNIPIVFATVANPFIIHAGTSDSNHLPNVTGIYGWVEMDSVLELAKKIVGNKLKIGALWDPSAANSVFNVDNMIKTIAEDKNLAFYGATVPNTSEVFTAAQSLISKGINTYILPPDNIVYSAFESIVKSARNNKIPIFLSDVERLKDGAIATYGYNYASSGVQAAHIVDRIIHGENIKNIPFEKFKKIIIGLNLKTAKEIGIEISNEVYDKANYIINTDGTIIDKTIQIGK